MKKVLLGLLIGLGLVVGSGFVNEVSACEDCNIERIETEEHADCVCGSFQLQCENCGGLYCQEYACECGRCEGIVDEANEVNVVMNYEEYYVFEEIVFDMYLEACVNACDECGYYYYEECMCEACEEAEECDECFYYDYELFIADNYEMIIDLAEDIVAGNYAYTNEMSEEVVLVIYEF